MSKLVVMRGFPASGKTTRAKRIVRDTDRAYRVSLDDLRAMVAGSYKKWTAKTGKDKEYGERMYGAAEGMILNLLGMEGTTVVYDAQNVDTVALGRLLRKAKKLTGCDIESCDLDVPLETLFERNDARTESTVSDSYIRHQYRTYHDTAFTPIERILDSSDNLLEQMRMNPYVKVKEVNGERDVYACNFTRQAFTNHVWNEYTSKARGLFLDAKGDVVMRGFDKFFALDENEGTSYDNLIAKATYPMLLESKENGFLGIIGADPDSDKPRFRYYSKSGHTDYSQLVRNAFEKAVPPEYDDYNLVYRVLLEHNVSLVCEIIDVDSDRHIIKYPETCAYALHAIRNQKEFSIDREAEDEIYSCALWLKWPKLMRIDSRKEFDEALGEMKASPREGGVFYAYDGDSPYPLVKVKSDHYLFVKSLRTPLKRILLKNEKPSRIRHKGGAELVRDIVDNADRSRLTYVRKAFGTEDVDMTYVADYLHGQGIDTWDDVK